MAPRWINHNSDIKQLIEKLDDANLKFTNYVKQADNADWSFDKLHKLEREAETLENELWSARYEENRRRS